MKKAITGIVAITFITLLSTSVIATVHRATVSSQYPAGGMNFPYVIIN